MNIYVGNLNYDLSEDDLKSAFEEHGAVESVKIIIDRYSGRSKGFGFVEMSNNDEAKAAMEALSGNDLNGRTLVVNEARPKQ
tara:strand:- start:1910 stop:2155 length:246 start_codon:yes stop_codon:yes gene_type:complete